MTYLDDFQPITIEDKQEIHSAVSAIAIRCDGASTEDGVGFNGSDTKFGHRCSLLTVDEWSDAITLEAYIMLEKYSKQLMAYGIDYEELPHPGVVISFDDARQEARELAREKEFMASRKISVRDEQFVIEFNYDAELVAEVRKIRDSRYEPDKKIWFAPERSAKAIYTYGTKFGFTFDNTATLAFEKSQKKGNWEIKEVVDEKETRKVHLVDNQIAFEFDYNKDLIDVIKDIPRRRWNSKTKMWMVPQTSFSEAMLVASHWDFEVDEEVVKIVDEAIIKGGQREVASSAQDSDIEIEGLATENALGQKLELRPFQKAGVAYATDVRRCFIADEMGLGKTVQALASIQHEDAFPALVVCPASLKTNWDRETKMWLPGKTTHIVDSKAGVKNADVVIINYDILTKNEEKLIAMPFKSLIFDESHYAKNNKAKRTQALKRIAQSIPSSGMILALTGTPVLNRPIELVAQLEVLDTIDEFGGSWDFRQRYCKAVNTGFGWDFKGASNLDELNDILRRTCYVRRNKEDVLTELPDKARYTIPLTLTGEGYKNYRMAEAGVLEYFAGDGRDGNSAQQLGQIMTLKRLAGEGKVDTACEWIDTFLDSTDRKLVVFAHHISVVDAIAQKYGNLRVAGKDSQQARQQAVDTFQNDPKARVIVLNMKAGGVGLTLTSASDVLFVEQGWTPAEHDQAEDRCHRIGQNDNVSAWYLLAEETVDTDIYRLIEEKRKVVDAVTDGEDQETSSILNDLVKSFIQRTEV